MQAEHIHLSGCPGAAPGPHACATSSARRRRNIGHSSPQQLPQRPRGRWGTSPCFVPHCPPQVAPFPVLHERNPEQAISLHSTHQNVVRNGKPIRCALLEKGRAQSLHPASLQHGHCMQLMSYFKTDLALVSCIETPITFPLLQRNLLHYVSQYRVV